MTARPVVMYLGGFAKVGGIEAFARDFLLAIAAAHPARELVMWGSHGRDHLLLDEIVESGVKISRSPWRWGCVWGLPDFVLAPIGIGVVRRAAAVIFKRPPPSRVMRWLRRAARRDGRRIPFILVTPYRPAEYWNQASGSDLEDFDVITVQSEAGIDDLKKLGFRGRVENIPLLPPAVTEAAPFPVSRDTGVIRLGFLGRMAPQKNLFYLLDVYRALISTNSGHRYELHLFGDGAQRAELEKRCAKLALPDVTFHGETPRAEVVRAIDSCHLFLITSITEGQCLVALEVLSRGRPLVTTPVGALPEVLREKELGRLAPLDDPHAFAGTVEEMAESIRQGRTTPKSVVAAFRERFDYRAIVNRYLDLLEESETTA